MSRPAAPGRRAFLRAGLGAAAAVGLWPARAVHAAGPGRLALRNLHTGEWVDCVYRQGAHFIAEALGRIAWVLRDHRTDEAHEIDRRLLQLLGTLRATLETGEPFDVISGYRSPASNALLRRRSPNVAAQSLHTRGMAIDIRVPGRRLADLHTAAVGLRAGGVGYYPDPGFVHLDVGRVRLW